MGAGVIIMLVLWVVPLGKYAIFFGVIIVIIIFRCYYYYLLETKYVLIKVNKNMRRMRNPPHDIQTW